MSRDIYVQDLPPEADAIRDIPDGWIPGPLPFTAADVIAAVRELLPGADFSDPTWGHVVFPGVDIEVSVSDANPLKSFALHVRASDVAAADAFVGALLRRLKVRAFDPEGAPASGIFGNG